jgi:hypothetical protein
LSSDLRAKKPIPIFHRLQQAAKQSTIICLAFNVLQILARAFQQGQNLQDSIHRFAPSHFKLFAIPEEIAELAYLGDKFLSIIKKIKHRGETSSHDNL